LKPTALNLLGSFAVQLALLLTFFNTIGRSPVMQDGRLSPETARGLWESSQASEKAGDPDKTAASLKPLLQTFPDNPMYLALSAETHRQLHQPAEEASDWERYIKVAPQPAEACPALGRAYEAMGLPDKALDAHRRCLAMDPTKSDLMLYLALALERRREMVEAEKWYRATLARSPGYGDAQIGLARVLIFRGRIREAETLSQTALHDTPDNTDALLVGAMIAEKKRRPQQGVLLLEKALRLSPNYEDLRVVLDRLRWEKQGPR